MMPSKKHSRSPSPTDITPFVRRCRRPRSPTLVERINVLSLEHLTTHFLPPRDPHLQFDNYTIELTTANALHDDEFHACFQMLEGNMKEGYVHSSLGWHPKKKKNEMRHPAMRYLLLSETTSSNSLPPTPSSAGSSPAHSAKHIDEKDGENDYSEEEHEANGQEAEEDRCVDKDSTTIIGFLSFMITEEEGAEVVYTYELNLSKSHQKLGLGKKLLHVVEHFGRQVGVEKAMLTVFDKNVGARRFYERQGYQLDEISPGPIELRGGLLKEPTYHILSKSFD